MSVYYHSLAIDKEKCNGRMRCMRVCPTEAIRVRNGKAQILEELCIDCGQCINVCPMGAIIPLTDPLAESLKFTYRVAIPSPVLYSQFSVETHPQKVLSSLKKMGFDFVVDIAYACEWVGIAIQEYLKEYEGRRPLISNFCPTVIRLIQVKYPDLVELVVPIEVPREIVAREAKRLLSHKLEVAMEKIGIIYITPCPAKMVSIREPAMKEKSWIDVAISISDIYRPLLVEMASLNEKDFDQNLGGESAFGSGWAMLGRISQSVGAESWVAVSGLSNVTKVFDDIENSKLRDIDFIEATACVESCIGGALTVENVYVARSKALRLEHKYGRRAEEKRDKILRLYHEGYFSLEKKLTPRPLKPFDPDIAKAIVKMKEKEEVYKRLPKIDCGCCGSPSCMAFAEDLVRGDVKMSDCIYKSVKGRD